MENIQQFLNPIVIGLCLLIGNTLKSSIPKLPNEYIPLVLSGIGAILSVTLNGFSGTNIIIGIVSGLSATGAHQVYKGFKETKDK
ncbi:phage holin family protein [Gemella morbillorum]|uniref:phage holin family protein n=1 Tax=Gemella morbillorum TaxID=29391 RepID=UPI00248E9A78|nr:phage holin family protein [Gemella morbillorum]